MARAIAPAGASIGSAEAVDRRDGGDAFGGYGVDAAVASVAEISGALQGCDVTDQQAVDKILIDLDGTKDKHRLGANATVAVSMAVAHAAAVAHAVPLWRYLAAGREEIVLPLPEIQIIGGGAHAAREVDVQDFMVVPIGAGSYGEALDWAAEIYRSAGEALEHAGLLRGVADEGGYWPAFNTNEEVLEFLLRTIERVDLRPGEDIALSLDVAASEFGEGGRYRLGRNDLECDAGALSEMLLEWLGRYPIVAIEDPLGEDDEESWVRFTEAAGDNVQVIADDFICTSEAKIERAAAQGAANTALLKPNQVGTLTETKAALDAARGADWDSIVSARSGETEDVTIVHLAVGWGVKQLKVGSFARTERMAKWNEGLRIGESLGHVGGGLPSRSSFPWGGR